MANQLRMARVQSIITLHEHGWSHRRIARELGVHRETVGRYVSQSAEGSKPAGNAPLGSTTLATGGGEGFASTVDVSKPASNAPTGSPS